MGLFDYLFRRTRTPITQAAGTPGFGAFGGKLVTFENRPDLQGTQLYVTLTNTIANTAIVGTAVRYFQNLIGGTSWSVEAKEGTGAAGEKAARLVREGLFEANMPDQWSTCVKRAALYRMYGFSAHEWTMRRRPSDGALVFASIEHRPQSTIEFWDVPDRGGKVRGIVQRPIVYGAYSYIDRSRLWYCVDNSLSDSPDGIGLLRHVLDTARRLDRYCQLEGYGLETDMRGMPVGRIPYRALQEYATAKGKSAAWIAAQIAPLETLVENHIKTPHQGITFDSSPYMADDGSGGKTFSTTPEWALELVKGNGAGLAETNVAIERLNREIARCLGMEFLMMGGDGKGSNAQHMDKTSMFASLLEASLHELAWFTVHDLVYPLLTLNGLDPEELAPQVMPDAIATERVEAAVDALYKLSQAGAVLMPDDPAIDQIRRRLHLAEQPKITPELMNALIAAKLPKPPAGEGGGAAPAKPTAPDRGGKDPKAGGKKTTFRQTEKQIEEAYDVEDEAMSYEVVAKNPIHMGERRTVRLDGADWVVTRDGDHEIGRFPLLADAIERAANA